MEMKILLFITCFYMIGCGQNDSAVLEIKPEDSAAIRKHYENEVLQAGKPYYIKAYKEVFTLRTNISLADSGLIEKGDVVREFNNTVGVVMGRLNNFEAVKKRMAQAGEAYIDFVYKKACADIAAAKAAEKEFELKQLK